MINSILHSWSFHIKFMKLAKGSFRKFHINDHSCKILYYVSVQHGCIRLGLLCFMMFSMRNETPTLKRNRNATLFQWKIHGVLFKVLHGDNEPSSFQEMLMNSSKQSLK